jgi:hypothetical protein
VTKAVRPYSRVYWEALDDPKFVDVWDDDHRLATWLRLLIAADMAWPASAALYHGVHRGSLKWLCDVYLVDMQPRGRYRIHGLDKERDARARKAANAAQSRYDRDAEPLPTHPSSSANGVLPHPVSIPARVPSQDEPSKAKQEPSRAESFGRTSPPDLLSAGVARPVLRPERTAS